MSNNISRYVDIYHQEVHFYPEDEAHLHLLNHTECECNPVRDEENDQAIIHKRLTPKWLPKLPS